MEHLFYTWNKCQYRGTIAQHPMSTRGELQQRCRGFSGGGFGRRLQNKNKKSKGMRHKQVDILRTHCSMLTFDPLYWRVRAHIKHIKMTQSQTVTIAPYGHQGAIKTVVIEGNWPISSLGYCMRWSKTFVWGFKMVPGQIIHVYLFHAIKRNFWWKKTTKLRHHLWFNYIKSDR